MLCLPYDQQAVTYPVKVGYRLKEKCSEDFLHFILPDWPSLHDSLRSDPAVWYTLLLHLIQGTQQWTKKQAGSLPLPCAHCPRAAGRTLALQHFGQLQVICHPLTVFVFSYSPFLCPILCQYFIPSSEVRENCIPERDVGTQQQRPAPGGQTALTEGLKGSRSGS